MGERKRGDKGQYVILDFLDKISFTHIFLFWIILSFSFGILFFVLSLHPANALAYRDSFIEFNFQGFMNTLYYSFITVTTTGYGDITPHGISKFLAILEVICGVIIQGLVVSKLVSFKQETILEEIYNINYEEAFTNYRRRLALVRTDIVMIIEKIENKTLKTRELKDLWIIFSGFDQTMTNIKNLIIPPAGEGHYNKKLDTSKLELILNSMKLTLNKVSELIITLKENNLDWRNELLLTSIYYDAQTCREVVDYELKRNVDRKIVDKLNTLSKVLDEIETELKAPDPKSVYDAKKEEEGEDERGQESPPKIPLPPKPGIKHQEPEEELPNEKSSGAEEESKITEEKNEKSEKDEGQALGKRSYHIVKGLEAANDNHHAQDGDPGHIDVVEKGEPAGIADPRVINFPPKDKRINFEKYKDYL
ncbi:two pore domain potassium channel family protein [Candidatus Woesearchaeota archaeon]|nr:two pore domain potassium channel family protein [Candidatus Woesearchaeota archaeon]